MFPKEELNALILDSLSSIDENDIPVLVRTLLKIMTKENGSKIVRSIRKNCSQLNDENLYLLSEIISTSFNINPITCKPFTV
jgi:hypothetical protein